MNRNWRVYNKLLGDGIGSDERSIAINQSVSNLADGMESSPSYQKNAKVDGVTTPMMAYRKSELEGEIVALPGSDICTGDYVECLGAKWIVTELYEDEVGNLNGTIWKCNCELRFQNRSSHIYSRNCVVDDGTYSKKSTDPTVYVMNNTYKIYVPIDEATKRLYVDKRLSVGEIFSAEGTTVLEVYKIIGLDLIARNFGAGSHLAVLTVQRDVFNPETDSLEQGVCDVYVDAEVVDTPTSVGSCNVVGRDSIRIGTSRRYSATFADMDGDLVNGINAVWLVEAPDDISWVIEGGICVVSVPLKYDLVGEIISIKLSDSDGKFGTHEKKVQVVTIG